MKLKSKRKLSRLGRVFGTAVLVSALTACAGGAGGQSAEADSGEGFEYGAEQSVVNEVVADLEPVTLTYQAGAPSQNSPVARWALQFKEYIEERSNGKITIDIAWQGTIASYDEVDDALVDGRLDIAYTVPTYDVSAYPIYDALSKLTIYGPSTPLAGEAVTTAMMSQLAFESDEFIEEFESKGLQVLSPTLNTGTYATMCSEPIDSLDEWQGKTISVPNSSANAIVQAKGGSPVSLGYVEMFEALERNTIECTNATPSSSSPGGIAAVAPYVMFPTSGGITRTASANVAGSSFDSLPLAYQQIIFDADPALIDGFLGAIQETTIDNFEMSAEAGGHFQPMDQDTQQVIDETQQELVQQAVESGEISEEQVARAQELAEYWSGQAEELGLVDGGTLENFEEWHDPADFDFTPFMERVYEEVHLQHRPTGADN